MKRKLIANWKQNKTESEVKSWFDSFNSQTNIFEFVDVVVAPSALHLPIASKYSHDGGINISSQDISQHENGAHTGDIGATQIKEYAKYVIVGHSERRAGGEDLNTVSRKIFLIQKYDLIPIICFSTIPDYYKAELSLIKTKPYFFAYEPIDSISTNSLGSSPAELSSIVSVCREIGLTKVIYGGSVNSESITRYLDSDLINGFLVGAGSLDPLEFYKIGNIMSSCLINKNVVS